VSEVVSVPRAGTRQPTSVGRVEVKNEFNRSSVTSARHRIPRRDATAEEVRSRRTGRIESKFIVETGRHAYERQRNRLVGERECLARVVRDVCRRSQSISAGARAAHQGCAGERNHCRRGRGQQQRNTTKKWRHVVTSHHQTALTGREPLDSAMPRFDVVDTGQRRLATPTIHSLRCTRPPSKRHEPPVHANLVQCCKGVLRFSPRAGTRSVTASYHRDTALFPRRCQSVYGSTLVSVD